MTFGPSFRIYRTNPDFTRKDLAAVQASLQDRLPGNTMVNEEKIDRCVEKLTNAIQEVTPASTPKPDPVPTRGHIYPLEESVDEAVAIMRDHAPKARASRLHRSVINWMEERRNAVGAMPWNPWAVRTSRCGR
jgi:hypothetical protein